MIERSKRLDYDLAPLLSSLPNVSRMVTKSVFTTRKRGL
jgi:hypothetical protein